MDFLYIHVVYPSQETLVIDGTVYTDPVVVDAVNISWFLLLSSQPSNATIDTLNATILDVVIPAHVLLHSSQVTLIPVDLLNWNVIQGTVLGRCKPDRVAARKETNALLVIQTTKGRS